jgi:GNAT superfamily N-acetyltransferase
MDFSLSIRSAQLTDHAQLSPLFDELDRVHREGAPWLFQKPDSDPRPIAYLEALLGDPQAAVLVADVGECVGLATVHLRDAPAFPVFIRQQHAVVDSSVVHPKWRRKGVGRKLYEACEAWAMARAALWLDINVYDFNAEAHRFYTAVGFGSTMRKMRKPLNRS